MSQDSELLCDEPDQWPRGTLSFTKLPEERSHTSEHIQSWKKVPLPEKNMSGTMNGTPDSNGDNLFFNGAVKFQVMSVRIVEEAGQKKHVAYTICVRKEGLNVDPHPAVIERRYSDFLDLFLALRKEFPSLMAGVSFPRKVLIGNFGPVVIESRQKGFELLLGHAAKDEKLNQSSSLAAFLQNAEQREAQSWMMQKRYDLAAPLLENAFRLLNKLYTDRHPYVIIALCRLVACCAADSNESRSGGRAEKFAELALRRFEAVSDADLLRFYIPLLQLCVHLWWSLGKDKQPITNRLEDLKLRGIRVDGLPSLLDAMLEMLNC
ncbi:sorting nexin-21 isoform X1 [Thrips palmi]|uniref:Sorting nexin-21 isoform X1 n=2 Tax=Thrips palmi TaxID=161013 RepID=A0A6P8ZJK7_THRPL|nr:sorting nexin-21 isoform X1 [Thrips palmi]XP_034235526.1 sorting nexin-21 isoform X1 [Thrips palmi]